MLENLKLWNIKVTVMPIVIGALGATDKIIGTGSGGLGNKRTNGDHQNCSIVEIGQITKKSPGDWRRLEETGWHSNSSG